MKESRRRKRIYFADEMKGRSVVRLHSVGEREAHGWFRVGTGELIDVHRTTIRIKTMPQTAEAARVTVETIRS